MQTQIDTDAIRRDNDLADAVERELGTSQRRNSTLAWHCPFHTGDHTPSLMVYPDGHYHCFGCRAHGDVITWTMKYHNLDFVAACQKLGFKLAGVGAKKGTQSSYSEANLGKAKSTLVLPEAPPSVWQEKALAILAECEALLWDKSDPKGAEVRKYLAARGLDDDTLRAHSIGFNHYERNIKHVGLWLPSGITIPYWHERTGMLYRINVRLTRIQVACLRDGDPSTRYMLATGSKRAPLGLNSIEGKSYVFVLEGEFDYMLTLQTLRAMGQKAAHAGALTMGSATSDDIEAWLLVYRELLDPVRYLIATDNDEGGQDAARRWLEKTGRARLWKPPSPCNDITELWLKHGYEGVRWWILEGLKICFSLEAKRS